MTLGWVVDSGSPATQKGGDHIAATAWPAGGGGAVTPGGAMAQLFRTIPQAANASHEGEKFRGSKRICTLVELSLSA